MNHQSHAQPVSNQMSSANKLKYAKYRAAQKAEEKRRIALERAQQKSGLSKDIVIASRAKTPLMSKLLVVLLFACSILLTALIMRPDLTQSISSAITGKSPSTPSLNTPVASDFPSYSPATSTPSAQSTSAPTNPNAAVSLSGKTEKAILSHYKVQTFTAIPGANSKILSQILTITALSDTRVSIRISLTYTQTTKNELKDAASELLQAISKDVPEIKTLTFITQDSYFNISVTK